VCCPPITPALRSSAQCSLALARTLGSFANNSDAQRAVNRGTLCHETDDLDPRDGWQDWQEDSPTVRARCAAEHPVEKNSELSAKASAAKLIVVSCMYARHVDHGSARYENRPFSGGQ
jgi:hypothetical protein